MKNLWETIGTRNFSYAGALAVASLKNWVSTKAKFEGDDHDKINHMKGDKKTKAHREFRRLRNQADAAKTLLEAALESDSIPEMTAAVIACRHARHMGQIGLDLQIKAQAYVCSNSKFGTDFF